MRVSVIGTRVLVVVGGSVDVGAIVVVEFVCAAPDPSGDCATGDDEAGFGEHAASATEEKRRAGGTQGFSSPGGYARPSTARGA